jgi:hypothetical protein
MATRSNFIGGRRAYTQAMNLNGLSLEQIRSAAPSVFAETPHESRSQRYAYIPTSHVLERLMTEGFVCTKVQQARTRIEGKEGFTKHLMQFARAEEIGKDDSCASLALLNSHDGSSRYKLLAGRIRYACLNGMFVSEDTFGELSVSHTGDVVGRVIEGSYQVIDGAQRAGAVIGEWKGLQLNQDERREFAQAAGLLRWDGEEHKAPVEPVRLLEPRRREDTGLDLWSTFNVVQENLVRGGQTGNLLDAGGRRRGVREIKGIDGNVALNRALWALTEGMAALKGVKAA